MTHATPDDVEKRLGRPLTALETDQVTEYLEDAESAILTKLKDALTKAAADEVYAAALRQVEVAVTLRAARLTDAVQASYPNTENWSVAPGTSRANVTILDTEWRRLGLTWYTSFSLAENNSRLAGGADPGRYSDINPGWGPWWLYGEEF